MKPSSSSPRPKDKPKPCKALRFLYRTIPGRCCLKVLTSPKLADTVGFFLDTPFSKPLIKPFIRKNGIDMARYEQRPYRSYNDFFTRKIRGGSPFVSETPEAFIAPCDSRLSVYPIDDNSIFFIKNSFYRIEDLIGSKKIAPLFRGGWCMIFRLCVDDYHHYAYVDSGLTGKTRHIPGVLHTVQPIATESFNIYAHNTREVTFQKSDHFGRLAYIEIGAMMIGRIKNLHASGYLAQKGEEKGYFEYGGSTVVILAEKDRVILPREFLDNTAGGFETIVKIGETIGKRPDCNAATRDPNPESTA